MVSKKKVLVILPAFDSRTEKKDKSHKGMCGICGNERELPYKWPVNEEPRLTFQICKKCKEDLDRAIQNSSK
ncbi:MAG: hypothetical protein ACXACB_00130 [Promethearchaeota archaeon]|jgi:hypothetical protein